MTTPRCYDCLTEDVTVKVTTLHGTDVWFCAEDWAAEQDFRDTVMRLLDKTIERLGEPREPIA
jgi:hypothetical protein